MKKLLILIALTFALVSCGEAVPDDVINPDAEYLYFYGSTCPHCMEINEYMKENNTFANYTIEKREIYKNSENSKMFQVVAANLGAQASVPFVLNRTTGEYVIGTDPVKDWFPADPSSLQTEEASEELLDPVVEENQEAPTEDVNSDTPVENESETIEESVVETEIAPTDEPEIINE